ncbi:MAG: glycosyltransferase family 4 protein [Planctomycetes bacterium]|nr:glycosyltransferase family 4 protein [Planctomycetota bacterium]
MHVALITGNYPKPSETFVVGHVAGMVQMGHKVTVVAGGLGSQNLPDTGAEHLDLKPLIGAFQDNALKRHLGLSRWWGVFSKLRLKGLSRDEKLRALVLCGLWNENPPDVAYAHFATNGVMAAAVCKRLKIPLIVNFHGFDFTSYPLKQGWGRFQHWLTDTFLVAHTEFCTRVLKENLGMEATIIRLGIDPSKFRQKDAAAGWPTQIKIVVVGRLIFQKGQDVAIRAMKKIAQMLPAHNFQLRLIGDGEYKSELQELANNLEIADSVVFLGNIPHDQVANEMFSADIQIVPSRIGKNGAVENVGTVSLEGLCTGLAVVASDSGGLPESVGDGGILVEPDNAEALANAVIDLIENSTPVQMKERALKQAAKFTYEAMNQGYADILKKAVNV